MGTVLMYAVIAIAVNLVFLYVNKKSNSSVSPIKDNLYELRLHKLYWYIGLFAATSAVILATFAVLDGEVIIGLAFLLMMGGVGIVSALWYANYRLKFDTELISTISAYGKKTEVQWQDIDSVKYSTFTGQIVFKTNTNEKLKVHQHVVGLKDVIRMMESKTTLKKADVKLSYLK